MDKKSEYTPLKESNFKQWIKYLDFYENSYIALIGSVIFVSKLKNCLPFLLYPVMFDMLAANIRSYGSPSLPESSIRVIRLDGGVLKIC